VEDETISVRREDERDVECGGVVEGLLHTGADGEGVVLGLDEGDRDVGLVVEDVVGSLGPAAGNELASDDDSPLGEADFLANLGQLIPACLSDGRGDELTADVALGEALLVHRSIRPKSSRRASRPSGQGKSG
jgi:hypothetical protein